MNLYPFQQKILDGVRRGETTIISSGRQVGKSHVNDWLKQYYANMLPNPKIKWQRLPGLKLQAYVDALGIRSFERGLRETDMDPIQVWTEETNCGKRMSFNVWQFKNEKQITMFILKWA